MTTELKEKEVTVERAKRAYAPRVDIIETEANILIQADMPGVDETSIDITLEKNILSITGRQAEPNRPENYHQAYTESDSVNYHRSFTLSNQIDRGNIEAKVKDGVLNLTLAKAAPAQAQKIAVQAA